ncbi:Uncharacterised protein at_DN0708 [Pycnogonum litorale]
MKTLTIFVIISSNLMLIEGESTSCPEPSMIRGCSCTAHIIGITVFCQHTNISTLYDAIDYLSDVQLKFDKLIIQSDAYGSLRPNLLANVQVHRVDLYLPNIVIDHNDTFSGQDYFTHITFRRFGFSKIPVPMIRSLKNLYYLSVFGCLQITAIEDYSFYDVKFSLSLRFLYFDSNNITHVSRNAFRGLPRLIYLSLADNNIKRINPQCLSSIDLRFLHLNGNKLSEIPLELLSMLENGVYLDVSRNYISKVPEEVLKNIIGKRLVVSFVSNPIHCDCSFRVVAMLNMVQTPQKHFEKHSICCTPERLAETDFQSLRTSDFFNCLQTSTSISPGVTVSAANTNSQLCPVLILITLELGHFLMSA